MSEAWWWITSLLTPLVLAVLGFYVYVEYQARLLKTHSGPIPGGLRFEANGWSVEVQRSNQQLRVKTRQGDEEKLVAHRGQVGLEARDRGRIELLPPVERG